MNKYFLLILSMSVLLSCSRFNSKEALRKELSHSEEKYSYVDKNGKYIVRTGSGLNKKTNSFIVKRSLELPGEDKSKILETSVTISELGSVKKINILRPKISQYNVWFDGKKYFSEIKMNPKKKALDLRMKSPESQWNGTKQFKLPSTKALYCFYSQVIECARTTGFLAEAIKKESGDLSFYLIWEGYPFLNETFTGVPSQIFSKAQLEYDGVTKENERRFNLKVAGQSIFYITDSNLQLKKMFWVAQGISMIRSSSGESSSTQNEAETLEGSIE